MRCVAVVSVELSSRHIRASSPRAYTLFGDGAGAAILGPGRPGEGFAAFSFANELADGPTIAIDVPFSGRAPEFRETGPRMGELAIRGIVTASQRALEAAGVTMDEVQHVLPHQPNGPLLHAILGALGVDPGRVDIVVGETGSLASASAAECLDRRLQRCTQGGGATSRLVHPGDRTRGAGVRLTHGRHRVERSLRGGVRAAAGQGRENQHPRDISLEGQAGASRSAPHHWWPTAAWTRSPLAELRAQHGVAQQVVTTTERAIQRLGGAYEAGVIELPEFSERRGRLRARLDQAKAEVAEAARRLERTIQLTEVVATVTGFRDRLRVGLDEATWA
jgi:hypothetical protein